jgi:S-adenosylmethionine hydrolase
VHIAVVDPGVGTNRRPIAAQIGAHFFVGPDNGLFSLLAEESRLHGESVQFYCLNQSRYWLPAVSHVFHGRDIFAPIGAYLTKGVPIERLGSKISDPVVIQVPQPRQMAGGWEGEVIHIDNFGNLATNLRVEQLTGVEDIVIHIAGISIKGLVKSYGELPVGGPAAMIDSSGWLSIAIVNGNAAQAWNAGPGTKICINKVS